MRPFALLLLVTTVAGCFNAGVTAGKGRLLRRGDFAFGGDLDVVTYAPGAATVFGKPREGNFGPRAWQHPMLYMGFHVMNSQLGLRYGLGDRVELATTLGFQELGGDLRFALLDERAGAPVSAAAAVGAAWRPFMDETPIVRAGVDLSLERPGRWSPLLDVYLSRGPEAYASLLPAELSTGCGSFGEEGCSEYGPPRHFWITRTEWRLSAAIGAASPGRTGWSLALVPYVTLAHGAPEDLECIGCSTRTPTAFDATWGVTFTVGMHYGP